MASQYGAIAAAHELAYETVRMTAFQAGRLEKRLPRGLARVLGEAPRA